MIYLKSKEEIALLREAGRVVALTHQELKKHLKPGISTYELDVIAEEFIRSKGCTPSFKGYGGFPGSTCISINDVFVSYFNNNEIDNLPNWPVEECSLRKIDGSYNMLRNVKALSGINSLNIVNLDYNQITSVAPLANCHTLIQVNIFGNEIKDPEKLTELDIIINYDPTFSMADLG